MAVSMYSASVPVFVRMFNNLLSILDKAEAYAAERKFDANVLVTSRLAPDMHPLAFQVQSATDRTKFFIARVTGRDAPSWPDEEKTIEDLRGRIRKALDYLGAVKPEDLDGTDEKAVILKVRGQDTPTPAQD